MTGDIQLRPGAVLDLGEPNYCYGVGRLTLRIEEIGADPRSFPRLEWVRVAGREVRWDSDGEKREVMVRVAAIQQSLRPENWRPPRYVPR